MRKKRQKYNTALLIGMLLDCSLTGCGKTEAGGPLPTQRAEQSETAESVRQPEADSTGIATPEPTATPISDISATPEPVEFPVEITETVFPEELLRKKALAADSDGDGCLNKEEAEAVTKLSLKKLADADAKDDREGMPLPEYTKEDFIFDFEGIQYFTELTELTVNLLGGEAFVKEEPEEIFAVTRNFSRIYECRKIEKLSLYEADVTSLELFHFPDLKRLDLNCMYRLEGLDAGTHQKLSSLWISQCNRLETLDVSGAEKLKTLDLVQNDSLKAVRFGEGNKTLETIQLNGLPCLSEAEFSCLENLISLNLTEVSLAGLDVSKNTKLEQLCAEGLELDTLDLRNNPNIEYLINAKDSFKEILLPEENRVSMIRWTESSVTEFPVTNLNPETLVGIDIQGTAIKKLDVSGFPNLEHLYYDEDVTEIVR